MTSTIYAHTFTDDVMTQWVALMKWTYAITMATQISADNVLRSMNDWGFNAALALILTTTTTVVCKATEMHMEHASSQPAETANVCYIYTKLSFVESIFLGF